MRRGVLVVSFIVSSFAVVPATATAQCDLPGATWQTRAPADVGMDEAEVQDLLDFATAHNSYTAIVIRHGCLVGQSRLDPVTSLQPFDGWSMTKSATAMVVGRAVTLGLFDIDAPIGPLFPEADAAHGAITPRDLLTQTTGLHRNWIRELNPVMPDRIRDALSLSFDHQPGTWWEYAQSPVTLLGNVVERSVKPAGYADLQDFAQRELFGKLGIAAGSWTWERDRAGNTEAWAHLSMRSQDWARLGLLLLHAGRWGEQVLIDPAYVGEMLSPGATNNAYGFLTWLNGGGTYVLPNVEGEDRGTGPIVASGPPDMFVFAGSGEQRVFVIPSRDLIVVRLGERGSREADTRVSVWTGRGGELDNELVRRALVAVTDVAYDDPGPYEGSDLYLPPSNEGIAGDATDVDEVTAGAGIGPHAPQGCNPTGCS